MTFKFKTKPYSHQSRILKQKKGAAYYGLTWEQGACKTKVGIDESAILFCEGKIDVLLITAPKGVHINWITDEIPKHLSKDVGNPLVYVWDTHRYGSTFVAKKEWEQIIKNKVRFKIVATNYDAFLSKKTCDQILRLLLTHRVYWVADESHNLGEDAKCSNYINAMSNKAIFRRFMTGTIIGNTPFKAYPQLKFLNASIVPRTLQLFQHQYGVFRDVTLPPATTKTGRIYTPKFKQLVHYKNLDNLKKLIAKHCDRVLKDDVMDLPDKIYQKRYVELSKEQKIAYKNLATDYYHELEDGLVTAEMAMTRLIRFQQTVCGYLKDDAGVLHRLIPPDKNPRLQAAMDIIREGQVKTIIWARFTEDIDQLMILLKEAGIPAVRYDGTVSDAQKLHAKVAFQATKTGVHTMGLGGYTKNVDVKIIPLVFVANQEAGAEGLTLHAAKTVIFYSNLFKMIKRLQAEDRAHRDGLKHNVLYIDLVTKGTVDEGIIKSLRANKEIADFLNGDKLKEWI